jgi:hypothetical protein
LLSIRIPQSPLAKNEFELEPVLDMNGVPEGSHLIKVEMYELWSLNEKLLKTIKKLVVDYVPQKRESRFVKVPIVKSVLGRDLAVMSKSETDIYRGIEKNLKKEDSSKRDSW